MGGPVEAASVGSASSNPASPSFSRPTFPRQRSRGQLARRNSITRGNDGVKRGKKQSKGTRQTNQSSSLRESNREERPWLGGLYFTDLIFIAFTYTINLLRTCGFAELADVAFKGIIYVCTRLPYDLYCRWSLSTSPSSTQVSSRSNRRLRTNRRRSSKLAKGNSSSESETNDSQHQPKVFSSSQEPEPEQALSHSPDQLSPFHHITILLIRFACSNFPHLVPRVLFAEETIGPFVYWRTGGGSNAMVQEFTDLQERQLPAIQAGIQSAHSQRHRQGKQEPNFRAYLLSKDARLPIEVQRSNLASQSATTLLYLHGGGFSLGSVAFYAEALLRLRAKICALEAANGSEDNIPEARCVAVEYDLSPAARFPTPLLQCLRCYAHLIEVEKVEPRSICIAGDSAGGNLAMGLLLCLDGQMKGEEMLSERDWSRLPMPGKALLISPWVDLRPSHSHAFSVLRGNDKHGDRSRDSAGKRVASEKEGKRGEERGAGEWTEAVAKYEWDYVASESLLHFAQVYTGVLPSPRRVRGPLGWIAHICGVVAQEYGGEGKATSGGYSDPLGALSALVGPSKRLARATHGLLSDPLISKILGLKDSELALDQQQSQQALASPVQSRSSFEPLFTASDRHTDVVASKEELYEPMGRAQAQSTAEKIGMEEAMTEEARRAAEQLLESHPLLSPAIGDWSRIRLENGCLVTWGERERMAEDIEAWVDGVYQTADNERNAAPAQDGESEPKRRRGGGEEEEEMNGWLETAVERGPGGVHAWPFVSMYLAGSEAERERGLDLLADFIARPEAEAEPAAARPSSSAKTIVEAHQASVSVDPPHAAPDSPVSDAGSVGSMPSDVDLHGFLVEAEEDERFHGLPPAMDVAGAMAEAGEIGGPREGWTDETHGLGLSAAADLVEGKVGAQVSTTKSGREGVGSGPSQRGESAQVGAPEADVWTDEAAPGEERERGRSRLPRQTYVPHFVSSVRLHRPGMAPPTKSGEASASHQGPRSTQPTSSDTAADTAEARGEAGPSSQRMQELDDILEVASDQALSPDPSLSPPDQDDEDEDEEAEDEGATPKRPVARPPLDVSHYGLSHYAILRPEPEGLSDIAEEGSVLSASLTSADGMPSRSLSPERDHRNTSSPPSLTSASRMMMEQEWNERRGKPRWPVEEEGEDGEGERGEKEDEEEDADERATRQLAFSPPALPQPGPSIPVMPERSMAWKSLEDVTSTDQERAAGSDSAGVEIPRKKPKGDVWW